MPFAISEGARIFYRLEGSADKPLLVLVHSSALITVCGIRKCPTAALLSSGAPGPARSWRLRRSTGRLHYRATAAMRRGRGFVEARGLRVLRALARRDDRPMVRGESRATNHAPGAGNTSPRVGPPSYSTRRKAVLEGE
jgi:hypothetical protein